MAELRNLKWGMLLWNLASSESLKIILKSRSLQWALTYALRQQNHIVLNELQDLILEYKGVRFGPHPLNYPRIFEAWDRYRMDLLRRDDIVLDLGANIGAFSLPAARICKTVVAVEPLFFKDLDINRRLNFLSKNLFLIKRSIATTEVDCQEYKGTAEPCWPPIGGKFTWVRMDIGGAEWLISPSDIILPSVRHFEGEFHLWTKEQRRQEHLVKWLDYLYVKGLGYVARWSRHRHWVYVSADREWEISNSVQLKDGSFTGHSRFLWRMGRV